MSKQTEDELRAELELALEFHDGPMYEGLRRLFGSLVEATIQIDDETPDEGTA